MQRENISITPSVECSSNPNIDMKYHTDVDRLGGSALQ